MHIHEVRPRKDKRGVDLISDALQFGGLWYCEGSHAIGHAKFYSRSHRAVIRVYDSAGNVIDEHKGRVQRAHDDGKHRLQRLVELNQKSIRSFVIETRRRGKL